MADQAAASAMEGNAPVDGSVPLIKEGVVKKQENVKHVVTGVLKRCDKPGRKTYLVKALSSLIGDHQFYAKFYEDVDQENNQVTKFKIIGTNEFFCIVGSVIFDAALHCEKYRYEEEEEMFIPGVVIEKHSEGVIGKDDWSGGVERTADEKSSLSSVSQSVSQIWDGIKGAVQSKSFIKSAVAGFYSPKSIIVHYINGSSKKCHVAPDSKSYRYVLPVRDGEDFFCDATRREYVGLENPCHTFSHKHTLELDEGDSKAEVPVLHLYSSMAAPRPHFPEDLLKAIAKMTIEQFGAAAGLTPSATTALVQAEFETRNIVYNASKGEAALENFMKQVPGLSMGAIASILEFLFPQNEESLAAVRRAVEGVLHSRGGGAAA